jgi:hypothetical protein
MAGTRFNARGIDQEGNAANFVETELILEHRGALYSHVQVRGSLPVLWHQKTHKSDRVVISNVSETIQQKAFAAHFQDVLRGYRQVVFLNLLSKDKPCEE